MQRLSSSAVATNRFFKLRVRSTDRLGTPLENSGADLAVNLFGGLCSWFVPYAVSGHSG